MNFLKIAARISSNTSVDWRKYLQHWENYTKKEQDLLDFIAPEVPEQNGWDKYEKFLNFVRFAYKEKMITESELRSLTDLHRVVNP